MNAASEAVLAARRAAPCVLEFPPELPVVVEREAITAAIAAHQVVIVAGETGSGKTTQLPKLLLAMGRGIDGMIGHTQPRRLAARTVATRIASELQCPLGSTVGFQVRFADEVVPATRVKLMTDGILLSEIQRDRLLRRYDTLIIDEAHERSLNIDFLLGYLHQLLPRRPDLKLVITSATIDVESFSRHFSNAPIISVSGRTYPVQTLYLDDEGAADYAERIPGLVDEIQRETFGPRGDVLVFLPGERDIREVALALREAKLPGVDVLPLYARLSYAEQQRVFDLQGRRGLRVVLATNVAETSVTVPGIRYVIDPGLARISRYSVRSKVQRLPIEPISQASANQRQGRCGRIASGVCLRLYSEADFLARPEFTDPEILRTNLASVILQMLKLRLGRIQQFPFISRPDRRQIRDGYRLLEELGGVDGRGQLTAIGRQMAELPVDPRLARMIIAAQTLDCLPEVLIVVSALSVQDPRERPADKQQASDQAHARFRDRHSDFVSWINLWRYVEDQRAELSANQFRKLCQREFLSWLRLREWRDVHRQLCLAVHALTGERKPLAQLPAAPVPEADAAPTLAPGLESARHAAVHRALLLGLLSHVAQRDEGHRYKGSRNRQLQIFPGSAQFKRRPPWILAAEIVETSQVYAREVAAIEPEWVVQTESPLLRRRYHEPRWDPGSGRAMAYEQITLFGLVVSDKRPVHLAPHDPETSRVLLIREGLIAGRLRRKPPFLRRNEQLINEVRDLESRLRRRDLLVDEEVLFRFYDERLPPTATHMAKLQSLLQRDARLAEAVLLRREDLLLQDPDRDALAQFPKTLEWQDLTLPLSYHFEPGSPSDGLTVTVPVGLLNRVPVARLDYLVPGFLRDKCIAMVKGLPKKLRKALVPIPDAVDRVLPQIDPGDQPLAQRLAESLAPLAGTSVPVEQLAAAPVEPFYRVNLRILDAQGKLIEQGRELPELIARHAEKTRASIAAVASTPAREGIESWDFEELPAHWDTRQAGVPIRAYPALVDCGDSVAIRLLDYPEDATVAHRLGVIRLLAKNQSANVNLLRRKLLKSNEASLLLAAAKLERQPLVDAMIDGALGEGLQLSTLPRDQESFARALSDCADQLFTRLAERERALLGGLGALGEALRGLSKLGRSAAAPRADVEAQLAKLMVPTALRDTPIEWLREYPRYLKAIGVRVERLSGQLLKDAKDSARLAAVQAPLDALLARYPQALLQSPDVLRYRFMVEEFRVSLYAQALGTRLPVSEKRLQEQWQQVLHWQSMRLR